MKGQMNCNARGLGNELDSHSHKKIPRGEIRPIPCHRTSDCSFNPASVLGKRGLSKATHEKRVEYIEMHPLSRSQN